MANTLLTPDGQVLADGYIVMLARFPDTRWIVHYGWYSYQGNQYQGWYFSAIPSQTTLPAIGEDLNNITIVSISSGCCPSPMPGPGGGLNPQQAFELNRAWISVDTIEQLSQLNKRVVPDGKIVRVNDIGDGTAKYYRYDQANQKWVDETFGFNSDNYVKSSEVDTIIETKVNSMDLSDKLIEDLNKEDVRDAVSDIAKETFTWCAIV